MSGSTDFRRGIVPLRVNARRRSHLCQEIGQDSARHQIGGFQYGDQR